MDVRDIRMIQRGECLRFAGESRQPLSVRGEQLGQDLDRHVAIELRVSGAIHLAHSAFAKLFQDAIHAQIVTWFHRVLKLSWVRLRAQTSP